MEGSLSFFKVTFHYDANSGAGAYVLKVEIKVFSAIDDKELNTKIESHLKTSGKRSIYIQDIIKL